ncbi:putative MFS family arabinose efflux permease [Pseudonocardia hierapolitana]|uniref:Putative MFS family arabinose efflux permease n=1 Tax=Pseudonocardia hierapolitana TaxID=1128676 RepID=A0A561SKV6_9PSEU|nr:MFS transporter [Pseudonocardia hierapolitana]TWF75506.1 putative MFS family arabinose efflux permease [Pseudonocardia hierapolitana]
MKLHHRLWVVWSIGLAAYLVGVMHRTSFGVAGLDAAARFHAAPAMLAGFVVLQLLVYASLQIPVGVLLDRFGARKLIVVGSLTMAAGQLVLAVAADLPLAILARVLVGAGDALTFISVLSVVTSWFPARRVPLMTQLTGLIGQLGQVLSAVPLAAVLHSSGWTPAFVSAAALGVAVGLAAFAVVRDRPPGAPAPPPAQSPRAVLQGLVCSWREPGTRLGFWTHMGTQFSGQVFALMWGVPYLVAGQGFSTGAASAMLTLLVVAGIVAGPLFGEFTARHPFRRSWLVLAVIVTTVAVWTAVLAVAPPAPPWLLGLLVVVLALGGPTSMIGFDYARTFNPGHRQGAAVGIINMAGFSATLTVSLAIGVVLGIAGPGGYTPEAFRVAWTVQYVVWVVAFVGVLVARRRARRKMAAEGIVVPSLRTVLATRRATPVRKGASR